MIELILLILTAYSAASQAIHHYGEFDSPSNIWGYLNTDQKGRIIDVINRNNLLLYNNKSYTYLNPGTGTYSAIKLTLADASKLLDYNWRIHDDTYGIDHFQIILENLGSELDDKIPGWNLKRAKWDELKNLCIIKSKLDVNTTDEDNITYFSKTLLSIAEEDIQKTSNKNIISHGLMMIAKLQSDHARQLYANSICSLVLKI